MKAKSQPPNPPTPKSAKTVPKLGAVKNTETGVENVVKNTKTGVGAEKIAKPAKPAKPKQLTPLQEKLKSLPAAPGVYFHKNAAGEVIYVGKAAVLKNRVRQYFHHTRKDPKTEALVREIADTDWIVVDTEMDALFLESEMIKRYRPKWNILLRDDKTVSYVRINMQAEVPYVSFTRTPQGDNAEYVGPFYGKSAVIKSLHTLRKIFPYYDKPYNGQRSLYTDLGLTPGIEIGKCTPKEYKHNLRKLIRYLEGGRQKLLKELERQMKAYARDGEFEKAAEVRNQWFGLKGLQKKIVFSDKEFLDISSDQALRDLQTLLSLPRPPVRIEGYDISHQNGTDVVGSMVVFQNGVSDRAEYRRFKLRRQQNNDTESLQEVLTRRLRHPNWAYPDLILVDGGAGQVRALQEVLRAAGQEIPVLGRDKSGDHSRSADVTLVLPDGRMRYLESGSHLARLIARIDEESHRFAITYHQLLKNKLK